MRTHGDSCLIKPGFWLISNFEWLSMCSPLRLFFDFAYVLLGFRNNCFIVRVARFQTWTVIPRQWFLWGHWWGHLTVSIFIWVCQRKLLFNLTRYKTLGCAVNQCFVCIFPRWLPLIWIYFVLCFFIFWNKNGLFTSKSKRYQFPEINFTNAR